MHPKPLPNLLKLSEIILIVILMLSLPTLCFAQKEEKLRLKADAFYEEGNYPKAVKFYEKLTGPDQYDKYIYLQLFRSYYELEEYMQAEEYLSEVFLQTDTVDPSLFLEFGELLMINGKPEQARSYFMSYNNLMEKNDLRVLRYISSIEEKETFFQDSGFIEIRKIPQSTDAEEFNPRSYNESLYFLSNRETYSKTPFIYDLFRISNFEDPNSNAELVKSECLKGKQLTGLTIAGETEEVFFCFRSETGFGTGIQVASLNNQTGEIGGCKSVLLEAFNEEIVNPSITSSGDVIVFASISESGVGGYDLYRAERSAHGFSQPQLLGGFINTLGNENYPLIVEDSLLFFASTGHGGLGGYDIYYVNLNEPTSLPANLGYPINTQYNDFSFELSDDARTGFLVSGRDIKPTQEDIYRFTVSQIRAFGEITDNRTGENLKNVAIEIARRDENATEMTLADNGRFAVVGQPGDRFDLKIYKEGYSMETFSVVTDQGIKAGLYEVELGRFPIEKIEEPEESHPTPQTEPIVIEERPEPESTPTPAESETIFRVQIAAAKKPLSERELARKYQGSREIFRFEEDGWYKYAIGNFNSFFEANKVRMQCGVKDAFIAAYENSLKKDLSTAIEKVDAREAKDKLNRYEMLESSVIVAEHAVQFSFNTIQPEAVGLAEIKALAEKMKADPSLRIRVEGHSDTKGSDAYNLAISEARAEYVREVLIQSGIAKDRIVYFGLGERQPKVTCSGVCTEEEHSINRRVELLLYRG